MTPKIKLLLILLLCVIALLCSATPTLAWFSDVLSGASYEFVVASAG